MQTTRSSRQRAISAHFLGEFPTTPGAWPDPLLEVRFGGHPQGAKEYRWAKSKTGQNPQKWGSKDCKLRPKGKFQGAKFACKEEGVQAREGGT